MHAPSVAIRPGRIPVSARAVLFDLDDTLFDHRGCSREALASVQNSHHALGAMALDDLETAHSRVLEELHARGHARAHAARAGAARTIPAADCDVRRYPAGRRRRTHGGHISRPVQGGAARGPWRPRSAPGAQPRARIAIVSNNLFDEQREKLEHCGLAGFIDALVVSERVGMSKPDPAIFVAALEALQCDAAEAVMVGDSWAADIAGARAAGIRPIWFNPLGARVSRRRTSRGTPIARTGGRRRRADPRALGSDGGVETGGGDPEV